MEKVELDIEMDSELINHTRNLAQMYFGDESETSLARVLELAFRMRYLWSRSVEKGQRGTDEPMTNWEFPSSSGENTNNIGRWLFRR